ncbi:GGDEF domain-containing protein [Pseudonocardia sp. MCCB 268]|nr:GGDEF domain-containing protein [Pseudonocardia cytotoxica]
MRIGAVAGVPVRLRSGRLVPCSYRRCGCFLPQRAGLHCWQLEQTRGLLSPGAWHRRASAELRSAPGHWSGVLAVDPDGFRRINNEFGVRAGDQVPTRSPGSGFSAVRDGDIIGRPQGEEWVVAARRPTTTTSPRSPTCIADAVRLDGPVHDPAGGVDPGAAAHGASGPQGGLRTASRSICSSPGPTTSSASSEVRGRGRCSASRRAR